VLHTSTYRRLNGCPVLFDPYLRRVKRIGANKEQALDPSECRLQGFGPRQGYKIVMTSRDYIYRRARLDLKESAFPLLSESQVVIDVRHLTVDEKKQILYNHFKLGRLWWTPFFGQKKSPFLDGGRH
jgi:hypothetical protein